MGRSLLVVDNRGVPGMWDFLETEYGHVVTHVTPFPASRATLDAAWNDQQVILALGSGSAANDPWLQWLADRWTEGVPVVACGNTFEELQAIGFRKLGTFGVGSGSTVVIIDPPHDSTGVTAAGTYTFSSSSQARWLWNEGGFSAEPAAEPVPWVPGRGAERVLFGPVREDVYMALSDGSRSLSSFSYSMSEVG